MGWIYHAQRALTGEWLDHDLQLQDVELTWQLTGPGAMTAWVDPYIAPQIASDNRFLLDEWSTLIYAEQDGIIKWGGMLASSADAGEGARTIACISFAGYPTGRIWTKELSLYVADAFDLVRMLWDFVQEDPAADLDVQVSPDKANFIIGSADPGPMPTQNPGERDEDFSARLTAWQQLVNEPYELAWWNSPDCGQEIDNLMQQSRTDYVEQHAWVGDQVAHYINLYPEGRVNRRTDLRFVEGENIRVAPLPERDGGKYANYMRGLGAGEDRHGLVFEAYGPHDGRLRRDGVYPAKELLDPNLLAVQTVDALRKAQNILQFDTVDLVAHPNAPVGSWELGDEILIETHSGFEKLHEWMRISEWTYKPDEPDLATLRLVKPDV